MLNDDAIKAVNIEERKLHGKFLYHQNSQDMSHDFLTEILWSYLHALLSGKSSGR
jgi:hypothetical protein